VQIPILSGITTDERADFRASYPVNLVPVAQGQGISAGYLRPADGIVAAAVAGPGVGRGGINWNGECYRVMGTKLVRVEMDLSVTILGDVGAGGHAILDYSADRLAVMSGGRLYYWNGATLSQVVDPDLGNVVSFLWVDGYFLTTDGQYLVVTELADPFSVDPLKYGSSEIDPDPIVTVLKLRNEVYAVNRYTIEVFQNVGGTGFPFQRIQGAQIQRGAIGTFCACVFGDAVAFLGSGRNESPAIYLGGNGQTAKISTRDIEAVLADFTEDELSAAVLEVRSAASQMQLWVHLGDRTLVYDGEASKTIGAPVWSQLTSAVDGFSAYRAIDLVWCYGKWLVSDPLSTAHGYLVDTFSSQWGEDVRWEFGTQIIYNGSRGAIIHELELVALPGRTAFGDDPMIETSYSLDGETWSTGRPIRAGVQGERGKRLVWYRNGSMRNWRVQRFRGDTQSFCSFARLEAQLEPLGA
jgi:hypothetical protein